jgi:hypothetical protein
MLTASNAASEGVVERGKKYPTDLVEAGDWMRKKKTSDGR